MAWVKDGEGGSGGTCGARFVWLERESVVGDADAEDEAGLLFPLKDVPLNLAFLCCHLSA